MVCAKTNAMSYLMSHVFVFVARGSFSRSGEFLPRGAPSVSPFVHRPLENGRLGAQLTVGRFCGRLAGSLLVYVARAKHGHVFRALFTSLRKSPDRPCLPPNCQLDSSRHASSLLPRGTAGRSLVFTQEPSGNSCKVAPGMCIVQGRNTWRNTWRNMPGAGRNKEHQPCAFISKTAVVAFFCKKKKARQFLVATGKWQDVTGKSAPSARGRSLAARGGRKRISLQLQQGSQ